MRLATITGFSRIVFNITHLYRPTNNDFSPSNLQMITDAIHINMFDEVLIDILEDDRQRATNVHHRIEKRWLGKFILPFSTLLLRQLVSTRFDHYGTP